MNTTAHAVRLPRLRRFRPPSAWRVYMMLQLMVTLGFIAQSVIEAMIGHPIVMLAAALWSVLYVSDRHSYQELKRFEQSRGDAMLPPVPRWRWAYLFFLVLLQAYWWVTL